MAPFCSFGKQSLSMIVMGIALILVTHADAASTPKTTPVIQWKMNSLAKTEIHIPAKNQPTLLVFVMVGQKRSDKALTQIQKVVQKTKSLQVVALVSGKSALEKAPQLKKQFPWLTHVVTDPTYQWAGKMSVHVWPVSVVVNAAGQCVGRLVGLSDAFSYDLEAYLAFASGKLDEAGLKKKLQQRIMVKESSREQANLNLRVAQRLLDKGLFSAAKQQLIKGIKSYPDHGPIRLALAQVYLQMDKPDLASEQLKKWVASPKKSENLPPHSSNLSWEWELVRARIALTQKKWDEAKARLTVLVNQKPASKIAHYLLGRVLEHQGQWEQAAMYFRKAFEQSHDARSLSPQEQR